jgi:hypothetical protein
LREKDGQALMIRNYAKCISKNFAKEIERNYER